MAILNKTGITDGGTIQSEHITRTIDALTGVSTDTIVATGSFTGSMNGILTGTASFATSASRSVSSSFATTASYALNAGGGSSFPFVGVAVITGSLIVSGSSNDVTTYTRNVTINASNAATITGSSVTIGASDVLELTGNAGETVWTAGKYSILDWRTAGESGYDGQINLPLQAPSNPRLGSIYFDAGTKILFIYNGTSFSEFAPTP
jgi:hypothetical protein